MGNKDDRRIVIDEIGGMLVAFWGIPVISTISPLVIGIIGLVFFRIFDILKPYPTRRLETIPGGFGVMADDIAAGIYTNIVIRLIICNFL